MNNHADSTTPRATPGSTPTQPVELDVLRLTRRGHGLALLGDRPVFLPNTDAGERVRASVSEVRQRLQGHVLEVIKSSPHRRDAECTNARRCPGCQVRHLTRSRQMNLSLSRIQGMVHGAVGMETLWSVIAEAPRDGARSRVVARALRDGAGRLTLGMAATDGDVVPLGECPVQSMSTRELISIVQEALRAADFTAFDPQTREGTVRHVFAEASSEGSRVVIALAHEVPDARFASVLANRPKTSLAVDVLPKRGAGTFSAPRALRGSLSMELEIDGDRLRATLPAWTPQAPETVPALRCAVLRRLNPTPTDHVMEIGCGVGTLSLPIARRSGRLTGIDRCRAAVDDAEHNVRRGGADGARFFVGDARHALRRALSRGESAELVLLHAMRRPFGPAVMSAIRALRPRRLVYLAPNPAALADYLRALVGDRGHDRAAAPHPYVLTHGGVIDQSPGTTDLLTMVTLESPRDSAD